MSNWEWLCALCRSDLESVNNELNDRLTSLKADNESLRTQLNDANAALAKVMLSSVVAAATQDQWCSWIHLDPRVWIRIRDILIHFRVYLKFITYWSWDVKHFLWRHFKKTKFYFTVFSQNWHLCPSTSSKNMDLSQTWVHHQTWVLHYWLGL